ncbi:MAG: DcaP family trimeric outer membrane transporter [Marinifilaceae bacterium]
MKNTTFVLTLLLLMSSLWGNAQEKKKPFPISVKMGGYVHTGFIYDSRQTVSAREGHVMLYPKNEILDPNGKDLNASNSFNMAVIQSRTWTRITGPEILGGKSSGLLEAEFMGNGEKDVNGFRVRHAYVKLDWGKTSLLVGQTWSPMFTLEVLPGQVGTNSGLPFKPFARNPQVRLTHRTDNWKFLAAILTERDYTSTGPDGASNKYVRNAALPIAQGQIHYYAGKHLFGTTAEVKTIKPALSNSIETENGTVNYQADNTLTSWAVMGYAKFDFKPFTFKVQSTYGSNLTDVLMLGGYAEKSVDATTGEAEFTPIEILAGWCDLDYTPGKVGVGVFAGYSQNLGANDEIAGSIYSRGKDIDELYRIAPRVNVNLKNLRLQLEGEYTAAAYGVTNSKGKVDNAQWVGNTRMTLAVYYFF